MSEELIEVGDFVHVHFTRGNTINGAKVLHIPSATGDCWKLLIGINEPINVMLFERMTLFKKGRKK